MPQRVAQLETWVRHHVGDSSIELHPIVNDASARRFFRFSYNLASYIAIDAPPDKEDAHAFVAIAKALESHDLPVPEIFSVDYENGFLLVSDLGDKQLFQVIKQENVSDYYLSAIELIQKIQTIKQAPHFTIPHFDEKFIDFELSLFETWFLKKYLACPITKAEKQLVNKMFSLLIKNDIEQPQVFMHRDFHSRNLLVNEKNELGIVDFQSAMFGPITYDLIGLLKDCYVSWSEEMVQMWSRHYYNKIKTDLNNISFEQFLKWFHFTGLQRHIKILGSFSRSYLRDNKPIYLEEIPRVLNYIELVIDKYEELFFFKNFLQSIKLAAFAKITEGTK